MNLIGAGVGFPAVSRHWRLVRDGNNDAREFFDRHYSRYFYADGRRPKLFVGPGGKMVLINEAADALFVWRKFKSADRQRGLNCAIFRNESATLSSELILEAEFAAVARWPMMSRFFTYVDPRKIRSTNPGACFLAAGWRRCGITAARKLVILEKVLP